MKYQVIFVCTLILAFTVYSQDLRFTESEGAVILMHGDRTVYRYNTRTVSLNGQYPRANYIHPLFDLEGDTLTEDFPEDHPHHRGIFWSWHQLYTGAERIGDPWLCQGLTWEVDSISSFVDDGRASLRATVFWRDEKKNRRLVKEAVHILYSRPDPGYYLLDFHITLQALVEGLRIGGSEDVKGYGGFSVRLKTEDGFVFYGKDGPVIPRNTVVSAGSWIDVKEEPADESGVIIVADTTVIPNFQGWILRKERSLQNPAFPGRSPVLIEAGKPLTMKNRLIVYRKPVPAQLKKIE